MYSEIFKHIEQANKIAIITHKTPDGDAFGSALMLYEFIKINYSQKEVYLYTSDYVKSDAFDKMIKGISLNCQQSDFDLAITVDCATLDRFDKFNDIFNNAKFTINIDHHQDNSRFAKINFVDPISSCSELLFNILKSSNLKLNKRLSSVACAGMITDTNYFSVPTITSDTFKTIQHLKSLGADVVNIRKLFYSGNQANHFKLIGRAISKSEFFFDDKLLLINLTDQDFADCGVEEDNGGLINQIFAMSTAKCCFLITPRKGLKHISMRCVEGLNVNVVAKQLNGGGHICASAGNVDFDDQTIYSIILSEMEKQLFSYSEIDKDLF